MANALRNRVFAGVCCLALASGALGCSGQVGDGDVQATVAALSVCDETVPSNRNIDGIPAYAQCMASQSAAIYSDDGINTATTQMGPEWIRTQYSGGYQCTEFAHRYLYFRWDVNWIPRGNAGTWCDTQPPATAGVVQTMSPVHGDIMVLAPGSCGADSTTGHVNVIDVVNADGSLVAVEQNGARRGTYKATCPKCFLHVVANDGTPGSIPANPNPMPGTAGSGAPPAGTAGSAAPMTPPPATPPPTTPATPAPTTPATPPPAVPAAPAGTPMAGSAAPVPAAPTQQPGPAPAPTAMTNVPPAVQGFMPAMRSDAVAEDSGGCAVRAGGHSSSAALGWIALGLLAIVRRRKR